MRAILLLLGGSLPALAASAASPPAFCTAHFNRTDRVAAYLPAAGTCLVRVPRTFDPPTTKRLLGPAEAECHSIAAESGAAGRLYHPRAADGRAADWTIAKAVTGTWSGTELWVGVARVGMDTIYCDPCLPPDFGIAVPGVDARAEIESGLDPMFYQVASNAVYNPNPTPSGWIHHRAQTFNAQGSLCELFLVCPPINVTGLSATNVTYSSARRELGSTARLDCPFGLPPVDLTCVDVGAGPDWNWPDPTYRDCRKPYHPGLRGTIAVLKHGVKGVSDRVTAKAPINLGRVPSLVCGKLCLRHADCWGFNFQIVDFANDIGDCWSIGGRIEANATTPHPDYAFGHFRFP